MALHANIKPALIKLQNTILQLTSNEKSDLHDIISSMDFSDLNKVLYRCDQEERDETYGRFGVYNVPGYGSLVYAGLQGVINLHSFSICIILILFNKCHVFKLRCYILTG